MVFDPKTEFELWKLVKATQANVLVMWFLEGFKMGYYP